MKVVRKALLNTVSSFLLQFFSIVSGLIIPRIILGVFGSETNGLVSSLSQFLNYVAILEGGLNGVIMANLYKPIVRKDTKKISAIIYTSKRFFKKISIALVLYSISLAVIFPFFTKSTFSFEFICTLTLVLSFKLFVQYCFSFSYQNLLKAGKYAYIINFTQIIVISLDIISAVIVSHFFPSIHLLKIVSAIIFLIQPFVCSYACKKLFMLEEKAREDKTLIKDRWSGLSINIAAFVHNNTDIVILSIVTNLETVSIYGVYNLVLAGIRGVIQAVNNGLAPSIGNLYASNDKKNLHRRFDEFEYINFLLTFFVFSLAILLITPFVMVYTSEITDADYYQPLFGIIIVLAEFSYMLREPYVRMAYMAGKFKEQNLHAYIEAFMNIVLSLSLVWKFGLVGIAIGTLLAMVYRTIFQILFLRKNILFRSFKKFLKRFCVFFIPHGIVVVLCFLLLPITEFSIGRWILYTMVYAVIFLVLDIVVSILFFRKELSGIIKYVRK